MAKIKSSGMTLQRSVVHGAKMIFDNAEDIKEMVDAGNTLDAQSLLETVLFDLGILRAQAERLKHDLGLELEGKKVARRAAAKGGAK